jgi:hypothetical protein
LFVYRYIGRLGFLDGTEGLIFYFLQSLWFRFLIEAKFFERDRVKDRQAALDMVAKVRVPELAAHLESDR